MKAIVKVLKYLKGGRLVGRAVRTQQRDHLSVASSPRFAERRTALKAIDKGRCHRQVHIRALGDEISGDIEPVAPARR